MSQSKYLCRNEIDPTNIPRDKNDFICWSCSSRIKSIKDGIMNELEIIGVNSATAAVSTPMCTINPTFNINPSCKPTMTINPTMSFNPTTTINPTTTMNPIFNNTSSIPPQHGQATPQHVIIDIDPSISEIMTIGGVHSKRCGENGCMAVNHIRANKLSCSNINCVGCPANEHKFVKNDNEQITVADYFNDKWKICLLHPQLPVVELYNLADKNKTYFLPIELITNDK
ncbi:unnamed protein product [Rotaria sp. Silwood1]|nr:unnamed protein product [Rotaria sp. Silwood1]